MTPLFGIPVKILYDMWSVTKFHAHPDIICDDKHGYIEDFRCDYMPASHAGSRYNPFCKPIIATMPGMKGADELAYNFFVKREVYLINTKQMFVNIALETVALTAFVATLTLGLSLPVLIGTALGLYVGYRILMAMVDKRYQSKADVHAYNHSIEAESVQARKWITLMQENAEEKGLSKPFEGLHTYLTKNLGATAVAPSDEEREAFKRCVAKHDERPSSLGLGLTLRPNSQSLTSGSAFYEREHMHFKVAGSDLLGKAFLLTFIGVIGTLSEPLLMHPVIFIIQPVVYQLFDKITHLATDIIFRVFYDKTEEITETMCLSPTIYQGAYWKWRRGAERSPSLA